MSRSNLNKRSFDWRHFGWATMALMSMALAQDAEPLSEAFLLFLAEGVEVDGEWQDPLTIAGTVTGMAELHDVSEDELVRIAERDTAGLEEINNGDNNE